VDTRRVITRWVTSSRGVVAFAVGGQAFSDTRSGEAVVACTPPAPHEAADNRDVDHT